MGRFTFRTFVFAVFTSFAAFLVSTGFAMNAQASSILDTTSFSEEAKAVLSKELKSSSLRIDKILLSEAAFINTDGKVTDLSRVIAISAPMIPESLDGEHSLRAIYYIELATGERRAGLGVVNDSTLTVTTLGDSGALIPASALNGAPFSKVDTDIMTLQTGFSKRFPSFEFAALKSLGIIKVIVKEGQNPSLSERLSLVKAARGNVLVQKDASSIVFSSRDVTVNGSLMELGSTHLALEKKIDLASLRTLSKVLKSKGLIQQELPAKLFSR